MAYNLIVPMWEAEKEQIAENMTSAFIQTVRNYQAEIQLFNTQEFYVQPTSSLIDSEKSFQNITPAASLKEGVNPNISISLTVLRYTHSENSTVFLAQDRVALSTSGKFINLIVNWTDSATNKRWCSVCAYRMNICVRSPQIQKQCDKNGRVFTTQIRDVMIQSPKRLPQSPQALKEKGNNLVKERNYFEALLAYELSLANISEMWKNRERAILYANSSICFYEMRLFENALIYADIAIRIDSNYSKGFFRKFNSLLELKQFGDIPHCLLKLSSLIDERECESIYHRFYNYQANFNGLFNWREIFKNGSLFSFGEYSSQNIALRKDGQLLKFYARKDIMPYELLFIAKPIIHSEMIKEGDSSIFPTFMTHLRRYIRLQMSFYEQIKALPDSCSSSQKTMKERPLDTNAMQQKIEKNIIVDRAFELNEDGIRCGIWPKISQVKHACFPNSSFLHIKRAIALFSFKTIQEGKDITIDFVAEDRLQKRQARMGVSCKCPYCVYEFPSQISSLNMVDCLNKELPLKIRKDILWNIIFVTAQKASSSLETQHYKQIWHNYAKLVDEEPTWDSLMNLARMVVDEKDQELYLKVKGVLLKWFQIYFRVSGDVAEQFYHDLHK